MSNDLDPHDALRSIEGFEGGDWSIEALPGGLTNRNFRVRRGDDTLVLRLDDEHTASFSLDRHTELRVRKQAAAAGLATEIVFADTDNGILLCEFAEGRVWDDSDLESKENLETLARRMRDIHQMPVVGKQLDTSRAARTYVRNLADRPGLLAFGERCQQLIDETPRAEIVTCCHNDVIAANVVENDGIRFLDWEYACDNHPMFELASVIGFHNLDQDQADVLFEAYYDGPNPQMREQLDEQLRLFDAFQWLWYAVRHRMSPNSRLAMRLEEIQQRIF